MSVELARNSIGNGGSQLFNCFGVDSRLCFLNKRNIGFINVYNKILRLVREKVLNHVINRNIVCFNPANEYYRARNIGIKVKLARL